jgi:UDP-GlcNAc3NAcA epimerase
MKKLAIVVGARPQFIKLAPLVDILSPRTELVIIHTGQHYDFEMSDIFFKQLKLPKVDFHLGIGSAGQASQVGKMMIKLEEVFLSQKPEAVIVIGDTNSTLAGALAAAKNYIPLVHIEAGLRSKNGNLPEQINRLVTDRLSDILCCPDKNSIENVNAEGISNNVFLTGDILYDLIANIKPSNSQVDAVLKDFGLKRNEFILMTMHRAENVDRPDFLKHLIEQMGKIHKTIFLPLHPRTEKNLQQFGLYDKFVSIPDLKLSKPIGIIESLALTNSCFGVITDSGGLQREAAYFGKKSYILRNETEWLELEAHGIVQCLGSKPVLDSLKWDKPEVPSAYFAKAAPRIAEYLFNNL